MAAAEGHHLRPGDAALHPLGFTQRSDLVPASVQDGGRDVDLTEAVHTVVGARRLTLPLERVARLRMLPSEQQT